ncbi:hypothetical protein ILYODFUR_024381 [Ilyodon furcidens]|uniref:Uncharacterized protein n=1 Tax=Ilyodon furcidens TaxID=33524 RepID=A0ABV0V6H5_9TELE
MFSLFPSLVFSASEEFPVSSRIALYLRLTSCLLNMSEFLLARTLVKVFLKPAMAEEDEAEVVQLKRQVRDDILRGTLTVTYTRAPARQRWICCFDFKTQIVFMAAIMV